MMKIFYSLEAFYPHISGVTIVTDRLASHFFKDKDFETFVITASETGDFVIEKSPKGYTVIKLKSIPKALRRKIPISILAKIPISEIFKKYKPEIIHLQDPAFISQSVAIEAKKYKVPVLATQHSSLAFPLAYLGLPKFLKSFTEKIMAKSLAFFYNTYCQKIITPSYFIKNEVLKWGVKIPVEVVSNGINLNIFKKGRVSLEFLKEYNLEDFISRPIVFYSGRIDKDKNLETFISAIPLVLKEVEANFLFLGTGDLKEELIKEIKKTGIENYVKFIGPISPGDLDIPEFYQLSAIFVIPSYIEAQSLVTMEAMASGLPIIASNGGALPELIKDNENGFLVNPFKKEEFAQKIILLLKDKKLLKRMGEKSLELITNHDINLTFKKFKEIYLSLINEKRNNC
ncbi:MAG: glycosyltransferase [Minisyncoccia bacterium]